MKIMTLIGEEVPTNLVPAVAVTRGGRALFVLTGRKGCVGDYTRTFVSNVVLGYIKSCKWIV